MLKKRYLAALLAPMLFAGPALAADYLEETVVVPSWTGFYIGAGAGVGWVDFEPYGKYCDELGICVSPNFVEDLIDNVDNDSGFRGIALAGFDWEAVPGFLIGIQGDYNFGQHLGFHETNTYLFEDVTLYDRATFKIEDMWTVAGRLGWAIEDTLFYGLAGWTWANSSLGLKGACFEDACIGGFHNDDRLDGWTIGTGVEFRNWLVDGVSTRFEYRYTDLGNKAVAGYDEFGAYYKLSTEQNVQGFYLTLDYRFDGF